MSEQSISKSTRSRIARVLGLRPRVPCRRVSYRPRLEALEDRVVPATFLVKNLNDAGAGSLRQAILNAEAAPGPDTIVFKPGLVNKTINLTTIGGTSFGPNALQVTTRINIVGSGQKIARATATAFRLFYISPTGNLTLQNLRLVNGLARGGNGGTNLGDDGGGGGAGLGGAIYNQGTLKLISCTLKANTAQGGNGGAGADNGGTDAGGGGGGGGMGGNGGTTPDDFTDGGAGGGGFFGNGAAGTALKGGGGGGSTADAAGQPGGVANGGAGGAAGVDGTAGGLGGGGGGGGNEATGGAGGIGGGGSGGGENDNATPNGGGAGGYGGGGGGGGEDGDGGNGGFGGGGGGCKNGSGAEVSGTGGFGAGAGGLLGATSQSGGGGGGAGLGGAIFNDGGVVRHFASKLNGNFVIGGLGGAGTTAAENGAAGQGINSGIFNHNGTLVVIKVSSLGFVNQPPASVLGGVVMAPITIQLLDQFGIPVAQPGLVVTLVLTSGGLSNTYQATTDAAGKAVFSNLQPFRRGAAQMVATCPGLKSATSSNFTVERNPDLPIYLTG